MDSKEERFLLEEIKMPEPVFFAGLEYEYAKDKSKLDAALSEICKEDSSLVIFFEKNEILTFFSDC